MRLWNHIKSSNFIIKLLHWEYWPFEIIYAPAFFYWLYLSLKARSLFFFSAANPGIENGGLMGESKINIIKKIPAEYLPKTVFVSHGEPMEFIIEKLQQSGITFPIIAKPNIGSRGFLVKKICQAEELTSFMNKHRVNFLLQEYVNYPMETSVMYYRFPNQSKGTITSLTIKKYLTIVGDGRSTVLELIKKFDRAKLQLHVLKETHKDILHQIPSKNETVELVPIGNHCRGAAFFNGNHLVNEDMTRSFDRISHQLDGIYFGRFDIKCANLESLQAGKSMKILEINGVGAEPAHIYDPGYSIFQAFRDILRQWNIIYRISVYNRGQGQAFMSFQEAYQKLMALFAYKRLARG